MKSIKLEQNVIACLTNSTHFNPLSAFVQYSRECNRKVNSKVKTIVCSGLGGISYAGFWKFQPWGFLQIGPHFLTQRSFQSHSYKCP